MRPSKTALAYSAAIVFLIASAARLLFSSIGLEDSEKEQNVSAPASRLLAGAQSPLASPAWSRSLFRPADLKEDSTGTIPGSSTSVNAPPPTLIGVLTAASHRVAIVSTAGKIQRVRENERLGDWIVAKIEPKSALLQRGPQTHRLLLDAPTASK